MKRDYDLSLKCKLPLMCVPTCLKAIFLRQKIKMSVSRLEIAKLLDFRSAPQVSYLFPDFPVAEDPHYYGCNVTDLNRQLFKMLNIPLSESYVASSKGGIEGILLKNGIYYSHDSYDLIVYYDYRVISKGTTEAKHASLIYGIDDNNVTLYVPHERKNFIATINKDKLINSIKKVNGGISIIRLYRL